MKNTFKKLGVRVISLLVTLSMLLAVVPFNALAAGSTTTYSVTVDPSTETVEAGSTVSLTATVTKTSGKTTSTVTDLSNEGIVLWWWTDTWASGHTSGNNDATYSTAGGDGTSLTTNVVVPSVGTYYVAAQVKDSSDTQLAIVYATITVTEATEAKTYAVSVTSSAATVSAGSTVTLDATVTLNGETITDLEAAGLSVTTWLDYYEDNGHGDGNSDATIASPNALSTTVTLPTEGTYYLVTDVYNSSWAKLASYTTTITVTEASTEPTDPESSVGYVVTVTPSTTDVKAGDTVTLTAVVTYNGTEITDLKTAGLYLWWWTDTWADGHTDGKSDAEYTNYDGNSGLSLTADVTFPSEGTYYIAAELKDSSSSLTTTFTTFSVAAGEVDTDTTVTPVEGLACDFALGVDISSIVVEFNSGVTYKDFDGNTINNVTDFCKFLKECGVNTVRVRVWNDPYDSSGNGYGGGNNDVATAVKIAQGCAAAGLDMLVDFHYSDFWVDPGKQTAPKAWASMTVAQKAAALKTFTTDSLTQIAATGVNITMVQVGNETTGGIAGLFWSDAAYASNWDGLVDDMCTLFTAGSEAIRAFDEDIKVVIHITNPNDSKMTYWAGELNSHNVDYDVLATSYYSFWHGTLTNLKSEMQSVRSTYGKDVMVAETSYPFTYDDTDGFENTITSTSSDSSDVTMRYEVSVAGQAKCVADVISTVSEAGGIGVFYWEPAWITVGDITGLSGDDLTQKTNANKTIWETYGSGWASSYASDYSSDAAEYYGGSSWDNQAMFGPDGTPLDSITVWNAVKPEDYGHTWGDWEVTTAATCETAGVETRTCSVCGTNETREVAALGHDYTAVVTAPTCTEQGYTTYTCSHDASHTYVGDYTAALGHSWNDGVVTKEATTEEEGVKTYTCTVCGETRTEAIPKLAVEKKTPTSSLLTVTAAKAASGTKITLTGKFTDYENISQYNDITAHGLVYYSTTKLGTRTLTVNTPGRTKVNFSTYKADGSFSYTMTPTSASVRYTVRAFLAYTGEDGRTTYVYSDPIVVAYNSLS